MIHAYCVTRVYGFLLLDKALEEVKISLKEVQADMQAWQAQYDSTHRKLKTEQATNSTLKVLIQLVYSTCIQYSLVMVYIFCAPIIIYHI